MGDRLYRPQTESYVGGTGGILWNSFEHFFKCRMFKSSSGKGSRKSCTIIILAMKIKQFIEIDVKETSSKFQAHWCNIEFYTTTRTQTNKIKCILTDRVYYVARLYLTFSNCLSFTHKHISIKLQIKLYYLYLVVIKRIRT